MICLETERLYLRSWQSTDLDEFVAMNQDKKVTRFLTNPYTTERAREIFGLIQKEFDEYGYGLFAVEGKISKRFIGYVGLHHTKLDFMEDEIVEIGWRLKKEFWGKGYATEAA